MCSVAWRAFRGEPEPRVEWERRQVVRAEYRVVLLPDHAQMHSQTAGLSTWLESERKSRGKSFSHKAFTNLYFLSLCLFLSVSLSRPLSLPLSLSQSLFWKMEAEVKIQCIKATMAHLRAQIIPAEIWWRIIEDC